VNYSLHAQAEFDLDNAFHYYKKTGSLKVALRFLAEFERIAELITKNPDLGTPTQEGRRQHHFRKYPYSILYKTVEVGIRILVIRHDRQAPSYGRARS
jgi:plasmid stabilization system protein ParE